MTPRRLASLLLALAAIGRGVPASMQPSQGARYTSTIAIYDLARKTSSVVYQAEGIWEAPNWPRDGTFLLVNADRKLYRLAVDGSPAPQPLVLDPSLSWAPDSRRFACVSYATEPARTPTTHRLEATPATVAYGYYWSEAKPVLRIASGDIVDVDTMITNSPAGLRKAGVPDEKIQASLKSIVAEVTGERRGPGGHILTGPIHVEGAEPGDTLEVKVLSIDLPIDYGYNACSGFLPENCDKSAGVKIVALDRTAMTAEFLPGIVIPLRPFFGSMGVAPAPEAGRVSSNPPGRRAGNLDNRELVAGTTLYIPVFVPGALFEIGDGHAAQGDGEVDQTAIETSLRGRVQLTVIKGERLTWPRAETPSDFISMASDPDLTIATKLAVQEMIDFLAARKKLTKHQAYQLVSVAGHVSITQLVDKPVMGVHVKIPKSIFKENQQ